MQWKLDSCISGKWCFVIFNSMSCISWNVRGIGGCGKDVAIKKVIGDYNPFFIGLVETKLSQVNDAKIKKWWNFSDYKWTNVAAMEVARV